MRQQTCIVLFLCIAFFAIPTISIAGSHIGMDLALDGLFPIDPKMYGERMVGNSWGKDMFDKGWSTGKERVEFVSPNTYYMVYSPKFTETIFWDWGFGIEFSQKIQYLHYSPNKDVDVTFDRFMLPLGLTFKWTFLGESKSKVRPFVGLGASYTYVISRVAGKDLFDQKLNPDFLFDDSDDADAGLNEEEEGKYNDSDASRYLTTQNEFGMSGWYLGGHLIAGMNVILTDELALTLTLRYETLSIESLDVELIRDGNEQWYWKERKLKGDAGGLGVSVGVLKSF